MFLPSEAPQKCLGPRENVSLGPALALDRPDTHEDQIFTKQWLYLKCTLHMHGLCALILINITYHTQTAHDW